MKYIQMWLRFIVYYCFKNGFREDNGIMWEKVWKLLFLAQGGTSISANLALSGSIMRVYKSSVLSLISSEFGKFIIQGPASPNGHRAHKTFYDH